MVREELKTKGCLFGHLSDINPSLIDELKSLESKEAEETQKNLQKEWQN